MIDDQPVRSNVPPLRNPPPPVQPNKYEAYHDHTCTNLRAHSV